MPPSGYTVRDVARLLDLPAARVRAIARDLLAAAPRGPRRTYRFSFQDLVLLRVAKDLLGARVPRRRIRAALDQLRASLPQGRSLSGLRIAAEGHRVVVHDGAKRWNPESGQLHFAFDVVDLARRAAPLAQQQAVEARDAGLTAEEWYELGFDLEAPAPEEARRAYERALALMPRHVGAHTNLGRLLHEMGDAIGAEEHYRAALAACPDDAIAAYNLGVALEDQGREADALQAYRDALRLDPACADALYNAAGLCQRLDRHAEAIEYLKRYRALATAAR